MNRKKLSQRLLKLSKSILYPFWRRRDRNRFFRWLYDMVCGLTRFVFRSDAFTVESHELYCSRHQDSDKSVIRKDREGCYANMIWDVSEEQKIWTKPLKDLSLFKHKDVYVCGDSDVVIDYKEKTGVHDLSYELKEPYRYGDSFTWDIKDGMMLAKKLDSKAARSIKSGIMMAGLYSFNYFHSTLDNLIRLLAVEDCKIPGEAAFIVDADTLKYDSLRKIFETLTTESKREVVVLKRRELLHVENLYYITHVNEFEIKIENWKLGKYDDYTFDWYYMQKLRDRLLPLKKSGIESGSRLFISRKNIPRRKFNEEELVSSLQDLGFVSVSPEEFSFEEQIALFNNADVVVGPSGAAMTNLLFCKPGAKVLISENMKHLGSMYSTIPVMVGAECLHYSIQNQVYGNVDEDYVLDVKDFMKTLRGFINA